jgi:hypothetical protein
MKKRSRRLVKKLHSRWINDVMIDASQVSYWRSRLFDSKPGEIFEISKRDTSGLPSVVAPAIRKWGLQVSVSIVPPGDAEAWLSENGMVIFKFWASGFPSVHCFSGNNPAAR